MDMVVVVDTINIVVSLNDIRFLPLTSSGGNKLFKQWSMISMQVLLNVYKDSTCDEFIQLLTTHHCFHSRQTEE